MQQNQCTISSYFSEGAWRPRRAYGTICFVPSALIATLTHFSGKTLMYIIIYNTVNMSALARKGVYSDWPRQRQHDGGPTKHRTAPSLSI